MSKKKQKKKVESYDLFSFPRETEEAKLLPDSVEETEEAESYDVIDEVPLVDEAKTVDKFYVVLNYIKDRAVELGNISDFYKAKEKIGYLTEADKTGYIIITSRLKEIENLIKYMEDMFPQGNNFNTSNNEKEESENSMALFESLNLTSKTLREGVDLSKMEFKPLKDYIGKDILVDGFFFTEGKYGKQVVIVGNGAKINVPSRYVEKFETIENDPEMLRGVLDGRLMLTDVKSVATNNGNTTSFLFTTLERI